MSIGCTYVRVPLCTPLALARVHAGSCCHVHAHPALSMGWRMARTGLGGGCPQHSNAITT